MNKKKDIVIGVDVTSLTSRPTGVGCYTKMIVENLEKKYTKNDYIYYASGVWCTKTEGMNKKNQLDASKEAIEVKIKRFVPSSIKYVGKMIKFNMGLAAYKPDVFFQPNYISLPFIGKSTLVTTVHDLSHVRFPEYHPKERVRYFNKNLERNLYKSKRIIAVSEFTKKELINLGLAEDKKIDVIHNGVSEIFRPLKKFKYDEVQLELHKLGISISGYFLFVGTIEPRKNLKLLLDGYNAYREEMRYENNYPYIQLVISGEIGWQKDLLGFEVQRILDDQDIKILGYVGNSVLPFLYAGSKAVVYPSIYEGFGLPALEGMASGVPVIASNNTAIPEVIGDAGILIDPINVMQIKEAMIAVAKNANLVSILRQKGVKQAKKFTWDRSTEKLHKIFQLCAEKTTEVN